MSLYCWSCPYAIADIGQYAAAYGNDTNYTNSTGRRALLATKKKVNRKRISFGPCSGEVGLAADDSSNVLEVDARCSGTAFIVGVPIDLNGYISPPRPSAAEGQTAGRFGP